MPSAAGEARALSAADGAVATGDTSIDGAAWAGSGLAGSGGSGGDALRFTAVALLAKPPALGDWGDMGAELTRVKR